MRKILRRLFHSADRARGTWQLRADGNKQGLTCYSLGHAVASLHFDARLGGLHSDENSNK
jgi:hypothetical protein